jgi:hypothetical protein
MHRGVRAGHVEKLGSLVGNELLYDSASHASMATALILPASSYRRPHEEERKSAEVPGLQGLTQNARSLPTS